jgi:alkylation response protein AidB-like acyl-CoA dehydrogenase
MTYMPKSRPTQLLAPMDVRQLIPPDALGCAVPVRMGGLGGAAQELSALITRLYEASPSAALLFWAQRMAIEFLVHADNVALREFLLPDLLTFHKSAAVPCNFERNHLRVSHDSRHLFLSGEDLVVANAQEDGFTLVCPVKTDGNALAWCVVDSEAQGFARLPHDMGAFAGGAKLARIELRNVFFRGDELLGEANLAAKTLGVQMALGVISKDLLCRQQT